MYCHYYHPMNNYRAIDFPIEILMWLMMIPLAVYRNLNVMTCIYLLQIGMNHRYAYRSQTLNCSDIVVDDSMCTMMVLYRCLLIVVMNNLMVEMNSQSSLRIGSMKVQAYYKANTIELSSASAAKADYRWDYR